MGSYQGIGSKDAAGRPVGLCPEWDSVNETSEIIDELVAGLEFAVRYLEHPDITVMPFAMNSQCAADRAHRAIERARAYGRKEE